MANLNNHAVRFRKGHASANPFTAVGLLWCATCRRDVTTKEHAAHRGTVCAYKRCCGRCGAVLTRGVYDNVVLITGQPLSPEALAWSLERDEDRR